MLRGAVGDGWRWRAREVVEVVSLENQRNDSPRNRFSITPDDVREAEAAARQAGLDLIGWYHSHPDAPARPSEYDREHAWPWYSYIIVSVLERMPQEMNSWRLADDRGHYDAEEIVIDTRASEREIERVSGFQGGRRDANQSDDSDAVAGLYGEKRTASNCRPGLWARRSRR